MAEKTLSDLAKELQDVADQLTKLAQTIVQAHTDLGNQLQGPDTTQKPVTEDIVTKQGG